MLIQAEHLQKRLMSAADKQLTLLTARLAKAREHLNSVGPMTVLSRGYAVAMHDGNAISSVHQADGDMTLIFKDGRADVHVQSIWEGDPFADKKEDGTNI